MFCDLYGKAAAGEQGLPLLRMGRRSRFTPMTNAEIVTFLMEPELCESAQAGRHNFIGKVSSALDRAGYDVRYQPFGAEVVGRTISHIKSPPDANSLCFRRAYHYPFWQIERSAERWTWDVAQASFLPDPAEAKRAAWFYGYWQKRLFGEPAEQTSQEGFIYVPLQGRISAHRPFQICSPLAMVEHCLAHTNMQVIATVHPHERCERAEIVALKKLEKTHQRLTVQTGGMAQLLARCNYVVTQNSSVAFNGYFFGKPALLFRKADFHHIAVQAEIENLAAGFDAIHRVAPGYAAYIHWFWQKNSINAGRPEAEEMIAKRLRRFGWPVP